MKRSTQKTPAKTLLHLQKMLTAFGLVVMVISLVATIFRLVVDRPYISDVLGLSYYLRYATVLIGGLGVGALYAHFSMRRHKETKSVRTHTLLYTGLLFGLFCFTFWLLLDGGRVFFQNTFNGFGFPWGKIIFEGLPLLALGIVAVVALLLGFRQKPLNHSHHYLQWTFIGAFVLLEAELFASVGIISSGAEFSAMTVLIGVLALLTTPFAVAILAYAALRGIHEKRPRLFYAVVIGLLYEVLRLILWEFTTSPEYQAVLVFSIIVSIVTYAATTALILSAWRATHKLN